MKADVELVDVYATTLDLAGIVGVTAGASAPEELVDAVVRRPTKAGMRRGRAALVRQRRAFDAVIGRMRLYRLEDDELDARRATAVRRATVVRRRLSQAIARSRSSLMAVSTRSRTMDSTSRPT